MSDSLEPHGLWHTRLLCLLLSPRVWSDSCPLSWWCYQTISSSAVLFLLPLIFPSISLFQWPLFPSGGQSIGASTSTLVLPMNIQGWFNLGLTGLIFCKSLLQHYNWKASIFCRSAFFMAHLSHPYLTTGKTVYLVFDYTSCLINS